MKKILTSAVFALAMLAGEASAAGVYVRFGPPPPPREVYVRRPSPRHVYVPGYYQWQRNQYVWAPGYWAVPPRPRAAWVPGYWAPRHGNYIFIQGYWR